MKAVLPVIASNGAPSPQMRSEGSQSTSGGRGKEGKKEMTGRGVCRTVYSNMNTVTFIVTSVFLIYYCYCLFFFVDG